MKICLVSTCGLPVHQRGWCRAHYARYRKWGDVLADKPLKNHVRRVPNEIVKEVKRLYVDEHLGSTAITKRVGFGRKTIESILRRSGLMRTIGEAAKLKGLRLRGPASYNWKPTPFLRSGYPARMIDGRHVRLHRVIAAQKLGRPLKPDEVVHHKNGNRLDNSPDNLEIMTKSEHHRLHAHLKQHHQHSKSNRTTRT